MYACQANTPQAVKHDTDIFTTVDHGYINQPAIVTQQTQSYIYLHRYHRIIVKNLLE